MNEFVSLGPRPPGGGSCERENANGRFGNLIYFTYSLYFSIASSNSTIPYALQYEKKQKQKKRGRWSIYHYMVGRMLAYDYTKELDQNSKAKQPIGLCIFFY